MADLRIVDAPVLLQESITDDVKMPTGGLGNFSVRLGDILWYVITKEQLANKNYVDLSSKSVKDSLDEHIADKANPHQVTKEQVGLGNVDNTADIDKPVSNAVNSAIITATSDMATKTYVNQKDNLKADKATTLSGYGITDAYNKNETYSKTEINTSLSSKASVNYVDSKDGDLTTLKTVNKTTLVQAVNEVYDSSKGVVDLYAKNVEAGAGANGWTDLLIAVSENVNQRQINDGLENVAQLAGIKNPRNGQRVVVKSYYTPNYALLNPFKGGGTFIYDSAKANVNDGGVCINGWVRQLDDHVTPSMFGAKGDGTTDDLEAFNKCTAFVKASKCKKIIIEDGNYKFSDTWVIDVLGGFDIIGSSNQRMLPGDSRLEPSLWTSCILDFDDVPKDKSGVLVTSFVGATIKDLFIKYDRKTVGQTARNASAALNMYTGHDFTLANIKTMTDGETSGIKLGNNSGAESVFVGSISNCYSWNLSGWADGFAVYGGNTSLTFTACYAANCRFYIEGLTYSSFIACASDGSKDHGYEIASNIHYNTTNITFLSCGSESCGLSAFNIGSFVQNCSFLNCYETNNNTDNADKIGAFMTIQPKWGDSRFWVKNIIVTNPTSLSTNGNYSIYALENIENIRLENTSKKLMKKPIGANGGYLWKLDITGDFENIPFTPTVTGIASGTISKTTAYYKKCGKGYEFYIKFEGDAVFSASSTVIKLPFNMGRGMASHFYAQIYNKGVVVVANDAIPVPDISLGGNFIEFIGKTMVIDEAYLQ